jgi:hypothetical protein
MKKPPGQNVPIQLPDGSIEPLWYEYLTTRGVLDMPDVDVSGGISNAQVLIYNSPSRKLKPGAN